MRSTTSWATFPYNAICGMSEAISGVYQRAVIGADRFVDVPLHNLTVDEQGREGVAFAVIGGMERTEAQFRLGDDAGARIDLIVEQSVELSDVEYRDGRGQLSIGDDMNTVRRRVDAVRAVGDRDIPGEAGPMPAIDHRHAVDFFEILVANSF